MWFTLVFVSMPSLQLRWFMAVSAFLLVPLGFFVIEYYYVIVVVVSVFFAWLVKYRAPKHEAQQTKLKVQKSDTKLKK